MFCLSIISGLVQTIIITHLMNYEIIRKLPRLKKTLGINSCWLLMLLFKLQSKGKHNNTIMTLEINNEYVNFFFLFKKTTPYCVLNHVFWKASRENQTSLLSRYDTKSHFFAHMIIILRTLMTLPCFNRNNATTHSKLTFFSLQDLRDSWWCSLSTLFEIFIFSPKIQLWFS